MGCGSNSNARPVELPKNLTIYGSILDNQTRSLVACCKLTSTQFILNRIDPLKNENKGAMYIRINPTSHIPMIEEGHYKVLGGNHIIYVYLCKTKTAINNLLMPIENEKAVKGIIGWHQAKMAVPGQQMFRMVCEPHVFGTPQKEVYEQWYDDFINCLKTLDQRLVEAPFLCG